jgi:hypothetical protein
VLTLNCEERLKPAVEYLRSIGLVERKDMERLLARNAQLLCCSIDKNLTPKFEFFVRMGVDKEDVVKMLVLFPSMFGQSIELSLEPKFRYLLEVMKRAPKDIVDFPQVSIPYISLSFAILPQDAYTHVFMYVWIYIAGSNMLFSACNAYVSNRHSNTHECMHPT